MTLYVLGKVTPDSVPWVLNLDGYPSEVEARRAIAWQGVGQGARDATEWAICTRTGAFSFRTADHREWIAGQGPYTSDAWAGFQARYRGEAFGYNHPTEELAQARLEALNEAYPDGPPMPAGRTFSRFMIGRYANGNGQGRDGWSIVVRWFYAPTADRPDLGKTEMGGASVYFNADGSVRLWNTI